MSCRRRPLLRSIAAGTFALAIGAAAPALAEIKGLELVAPSSPGSGYDQLARAMQAVLQEEKLASGVQVVNVSGGGGTVGLAQYVTTRMRSPSVLVLGFALVDVALVNWRGIAAPADVRPADKKALGEAVAAMVRSPAWRDAPAKRGWLDLYHPAEAFAPFLGEPRARIEGALKDVGLVE